MPETGLDLDRIRDQPRTINEQGNVMEPNKTAAPQAPAATDLAQQYRAIGPAVLVAALICARQQQERKAA